MIKDHTEFRNNAVGIDPAGCGCTDCLCGDSVPLNDFYLEELAGQAMRGRPLVNRTGEPLVLDYFARRISTVPEDFPDRWRFSPDEVTHIR